MSVLRPWFATPLALWLLALLPVVWAAAILAARRRRRLLGRLGHASAATSAAERGFRRVARGTCQVLGVLLLVLGIAGPRWGQDENPMTAPGRDLVVVLDVSRSMFAEDVLPSRLERAKKALLELGDSVQARGGHRLGLVVFAARSRLLCPLTHDYDHFRAAVADLDGANLPAAVKATGEDAVSGTRIGAGLRAAVEAQDPRFRGHQDLLLISDGDDPVRDDEWREGAAEAQKQGIPVHAVGVGNPETGSPIPVERGAVLTHNKEPVSTRLREQPLEEIARSTGGVYLPARTQAIPLGDLFRERIEPRAAREDGEDPLPHYRQRYAWFLGPSLAFLALATVVSGTGGRARRRERGP